MHRGVQQPLPAEKGKKSELSIVLQSFRNTFVAVGLFSFVLNLLLLVPAMYMLQIYDRVLQSRNQDTLLMLTLLMLLMYVGFGFLYWVRSWILIRLGNQMDQRLSGKVFQAAFERSLRFGSANAAQYLSDLTKARQFLTGQGLLAFFDFPWTPIFIAVIFYMHPWLGIFSICSAIFLLALVVLNELASRKPLAEANKFYSSASTYAGANLRNAEVIEAMGMLGQVQGFWYRKHEAFLKLQALASERASVIAAITTASRMTFQSAILGLGGYLAIQNIISPGMMIAASILMGMALRPVQTAITTWKQFLAARTSYNRLEEVLSLFVARDESMSLPIPKGALTVKNLVAVPPNTKTQVLKGISFSADPGDVVAIIGPSAAGKTTLARLITGIWPPFAGEARLDGVDVSAWDKSELGPHIGYLPQDIELLDGTVAQNIARFGEIDSEKVVKAATATGIHDMVLQFPEGYDTPVGEGGLFMSGGQKQRIALARAIYGNPMLFVLDEPNSNLDEVGISALLQTLARLKDEKKTVFVITHNTAILSAVDKVLLLVNGTAQAYGPRDDVLALMQQARQQQMNATAKTA